MSVAMLPHEIAEQTYPYSQHEKGKQCSHSSLTQNVGDWERMASVFGGGMLLASGLMRGGLRGWMRVAIGGGLLFRGTTGHCYTYEALGIDTAHHEHNQGGAGASRHTVQRDEPSAAGEQANPTPAAPMTEEQLREAATPRCSY